MNREELDELQNLLENRWKEIKEYHELHRESLPSTQDRSNVESGDWSQELEDEEVGEQVLLNEEYYLEKIRKALHRIETGVYGKCEGCGEDIPMERLRAKPSVSLCLPCQENKETGG